MKIFSKKVFVLLAIFMSCSFISGWSSHQTIWENEKDAKVDARNLIIKIRKENYSVQLSSFLIPAGKKGAEVASQEIDRIVDLLVRERNYDLSKHVLFAVKATNEKFCYCAVGAFSQSQDADLLCKHIDKILPSNPFVKKPANIENVPLDFVVHRAAKK